MCRDENGQCIWPGKALVRAPPAIHDERNIETEHEGDGNQIPEARAVYYETLEIPERMSSVVVSKTG